jgi:hypothetical protein
MDLNWQLMPSVPGSFLRSRLANDAGSNFCMLPGEINHLPKEYQEKLWRYTVKSSGWSLISLTISQEQSVIWTHLAINGKHSKNVELRNDSCRGEFLGHLIEAPPWSCNVNVNWCY